MVMNGRGRSTGWGTIPFRGTPSLAKCEPPILEVKVERTTTSKILRTRKVESEHVTSVTQRITQSGPFNFLGLPAELRLRIYELCVPVTEYITYEGQDYCTCGGHDHIEQNGPELDKTCTFIGASGAYEQRDGFTRRQPGCYYLMSPDLELSHISSDLRPRRKRHANLRMTPMPGILEANSLIRREAMPVFYKTNDFVFENCDCSLVTHWIVNVVQPQHLKYIKSISWDGPLGYNHATFSQMDDTFVQMGSIIMLMQLGILGNCKFRLIPAEEYVDYDAHFACILHDKISKLVRRKELVPEDAEGESSELDVLEVNGLVYCVAMKFSHFCKRLAQNQNQNHRGALGYLVTGLGGNGEWKSNCNCPGFQEGGQMSWIVKKSLLGAGGSTEDAVVALD